MRTFRMGVRSGKAYDAHQHGRMTQPMPSPLVGAESAASHAQRAERCWTHAPRDNPMRPHRESSETQHPVTKGQISGDLLS